jgi:hypothetical protein
MRAALLVCHGTTELPQVIAGSSEATSLHPGRRLLPVPASCPMPQLPKDRIIYVSKPPFARRMPVIQGAARRTRNVEEAVARPLSAAAARSVETAI